MALRIDSSIVRTRIAAALEVVPGWSESPVLPMLFPRMAARPQAHMTFAVEMPSVGIPQDDRQRGSVPVESSVVVRWSYRIRPGSQVADYGSALAAESALVAAIRGTVGVEGPDVKIDSIARVQQGDGTFILGTIQATAWHHYPLI